MGNPFGTSVDGRSADRHNKTSKGGQVVKVQDGKEVKMHITLGLKTPSQIADMVFTTVHGNVDQKGVPYQIVDIDVFDTFPDDAVLKHLRKKNNKSFSDTICFTTKGLSWFLNT